MSTKQQMKIVKSLNINDEIHFFQKLTKEDHINLTIKKRSQNNPNPYYDK